MKIVAQEEWNHKEKERVRENPTQVWWGEEQLNHSLMQGDQETRVQQVNQLDQAIVARQVSQRANLSKRKRGQQMEVSAVAAPFWPIGRVRAFGSSVMKVQTL